MAKNKPNSERAGYRVMVQCGTEEKRGPTGLTRKGGDGLPRTRNVWEMYGSLQPNRQAAESLARAARSDQFKGGSRVRVEGVRLSLSPLVEADRPRDDRQSFRRRPGPVGCR